MRTSLWAAAAAATLCAGQAQATTFVEYEAQGTGTLSVQNGGPSITKFGDLFFRFVIEVDPGYSGNVLTFGTGSYFVNVEGENTFSASLNSGILTINDNEGLSQYRTGGNATINLMPAVETTFSAIPNSTAATGTVTFGTGTPFGGRLVSGTVNRLVTLGVVSNYFAPSATVLPEPATWAMMILGVAAIGATLRRRRPRSHIMSLLA